MAELEYVMAAQRNGCVHVNMGCNSMTTKPQQLQLCAGWIETQGAKTKEGYCGTLVFNNHRLTWNKESWTMTNEKTGVVEKFEPGKTITVPALAPNDASFSRTVTFGKGATWLSS
jgi:hypothetical protein